MILKLTTLVWISLVLHTFVLVFRLVKLNQYFSQIQTAAFGLSLIQLVIQMILTQKKQTSPKHNMKMEHAIRASKVVRIKVQLKVQTKT